MAAYSFRCPSTAASVLICEAVRRYGRSLADLGVDLHNYAGACSEGAGFGWDTVQRGAGDMGNGTVTHMSRRIAGAFHQSLLFEAEQGAGQQARTLAVELAEQMSACIRRGDEEARHGRA